ncbi:hypothetical protein [Sinosporangium siamense]|uniref:Uncharacterized protein n=1 Tax=Sinosporangium siamense TaxID=1367973 RepID=A0A919RDE2_9ACTN|nr:hypothetical protein [Sinosporangium siamense]GII91855.1 hypothetical protein Ssi02_20860 [Sinosporangium siamense]
MSLDAPGRPVAVLADHMLFRELPFCGVLLDTRSFHAYRLSRPAAALLRTALYGTAAPAPYPTAAEELPPEETGRAEATRLLLGSLAKRGMIRPAPPIESTP